MPTACRLLKLASSRVQIKRAAFVLTERAGKEGKKEPAPGTDSSLYLVDPELEFVVIYEDKATVEEARLLAFCARAQSCMLLTI